VTTSAGLFKELQRGNIHPVYLLLGDEKGRKDEFIQSLEQRLFGGIENNEKKLGTTIFYGDEADTAEIVENVTTYSFFTEKKIILVYDFDRLKNTKSIIEYVKTPNETAVLVLLSDKKSITKKISEAVEQNGRVCIFWPMFPHEGEKWLYDSLLQKGIKADREAVKWVVEVTGMGKNELSHQIQFITNYLEEGETLTLAQAKKVIAKLYDFTVFDLCNALFVKGPKDLLAIFRRLLDNGEDLVKLHFFCSREIQKLLTCYALKENGHNFSFITQKLNLRKKEAERVSGIVQRINMGIFCSLFSELNMLDYTIKTNPREIGRVAFERFLSGIPFNLELSPRGRGY